MSIPASAAKTIEPFWNRLGAITTYPLQGSALISVIMYGVLLGFAKFAQAFMPLRGTAIVLFFAAFFYKFASTVLVETAHGRLKAPEFAGNSDDNSGWVQVRVQILLAIMAFLALLFLPTATLKIAALAFIALAIPGATMSAATDRDTLRAINPATWIAIMGRLGWPYFAMAAICGLILFCQLNAQVLLVAMFPGMPILVTLIALAVISNYASIASFHLMGYLIYQYHEELGWEPESHATVAGPGRPRDVDQDVLDQAEALVAGGSLNDAEKLLKEHIDHRGATLAVHDRYRKMLALRDDKAALVAHGRRYIDILLAQNQERRAIDVLRDCIGHDKSFQPSEPSEVKRLATRANDYGMPQVALDLIVAFIRATPRSNDTPANALLAAKILTDKMNAEAKALAMLSQIRKAFPQHPLGADLDQYIQFLTSLTQKPMAKA